MSFGQAKIYYERYTIFINDVIIAEPTENRPLMKEKKLDSGFTACEICGNINAPHLLTRLSNGGQDIDVPNNNVLLSI